MKFALVFGLALPCLVAGSAWGQTVGLAYGGYNSATVNLTNGQELPLQLDNGGNLKIDCMVGCSGTSGSSTSSNAALTESAPTGGNAAITTGTTAAIPASSSRLRWSYQVQGVGYACASWVTTAPTITVSPSGVVTCGGAGSFALGNTSKADSSTIAVETTPLTVIGSAGSGSLSLSLVWEAQ